MASGRLWVPRSGSLTSVSSNKPAVALSYVPPGSGKLAVNRLDESKGGGGATLDRLVADATQSHDKRAVELGGKVVVVGDAGVGKTSLVLYAGEGTHCTDYKSTIGVDFFTLRYAVQRLQFVLHIWDTAGQERFRALSRTYYRGAGGCIIAFDLGSPSGLDSVLQWAAEVRAENRNAKDFHLFLAGCKGDMFHIITRAQVEKVAADIDAEYFEVSSKSGENVKWLFDRVALVLLERAVARATGTPSGAPTRSTSIVGSLLTTHPSSSKVVPIGGGNGWGDPGAGKGSENWKAVGRERVFSTTQPRTRGSVEMGRKGQSVCGI